MIANVIGRKHHFHIGILLRGEHVRIRGDLDAGKNAEFGVFAEIVDGRDQVYFKAVHVVVTGASFFRQLQIVQISSRRGLKAR